MGIVANVVDGGVYHTLETSVIHGPHEVQCIASRRREDEGDAVK
jgi:hypothetical protein